MQLNDSKRKKFRFLDFILKFLTGSKSCTDCVGSSNDSISIESVVVV
jgi:hypothetical protein